MFAGGFRRSRAVSSAPAPGGCRFGETGWRMLEPGELVHVRPDLSVESRIAVPEPPAHLVPLPAGSPNIDT
jgi:hypothetical protein